MWEESVSHSNFNAKYRKINRSTPKVNKALCLNNKICFFSKLEQQFLLTKIFSGFLNMVKSQLFSNIFTGKKKKKNSIEIEDI